MNRIAAPTRRQSVPPHRGPLAAQAGFTLIELMIVAVVVAILASIAIPSYAEYIRRSNRASAKAAIAELLAKQESWRADRKTFATTLATLGYPVNGSVSYLLRDGSATSSTTSAVYRLEMTTSAGPPVSFDTVQAIPIGSQSQDKCGTLIVSALGARSVSGAASGWDANRCWKN